MVRVIPTLYRDLEFQRRYDPASRKRVPIGMPEIPRKIEDCSFFLFAKTPKGLVGPLATGFFVVRRVSLANEAPEFPHVYAVTNSHTAPDGASVIRFTDFDGKSHHIDLEPHEWEFIAGGDDIAVADVTDLTDPDCTMNVVAEDLLVTPKFITDARIGIGEDGFMLGLFADAPGRNTNAPVGRFGNLAAMADMRHPIEQPNGVERPSFIFDLRSRSGFSGSPVFIYRSSGSDISALISPTRGHPEKKIDRLFLKVLGVHCGQYHELIEFKEVKNTVGREAVTLQDGSKLRVPSSMTIIAPAWQISTVINLKKFADQRAERERLFRPVWEKKPAAEAIPVEPEEGNPDHKEDFMRLLSAAAKAKPQDGQT